MDKPPAATQLARQKLSAAISQQSRLNTEALRPRTFELDLVSNGPEPVGLLTVEQAAAYLGVAPRWVAEAVRHRRVRCARLGRHIRFRREHLEEFITANEQPVTAKPSTGSQLRSLPETRAGSARSRL